MNINVKTIPSGMYLAVKNIWKIPLIRKNIRAL